MGGSSEYIGALALAGIAALRSGCDSVVVAAPEKVAWAVNCLSPDLVTVKLKGVFLSVKNYKDIAKYIGGLKQPLPDPPLKRGGRRSFDCLLIGGGVSERPESMKFLGKIVDFYPCLKVLDAAALFAFDPKKLRNAILTPNQKELQRLKKYCNVNQILKNSNIIVAKSHHTQIITRHQTWKNPTGNPGLTKAGTGDVLAGLIAGFAAQSHDLLQSSINAVYFLGKLGEVLYNKKKGYFYLASDLAEEIKTLSRIK